MLKMPVKVPIHKDSFRIFHLSSLETARPKDGWTGHWLRPCVLMIKFVFRFDFLTVLYSLFVLHHVLSLLYPSIHPMLINQHAQ